MCCSGALEGFKKAQKALYLLAIIATAAGGGAHGDAATLRRGGGRSSRRARRVVLEWLDPLILLQGMGSRPHGLIDCLPTLPTTCRRCSNL